MAKLIKEKVHIDAEDEEAEGINFYRELGEHELNMNCTDAIVEIKTDGNANTRRWITVA